MSPWRGAAALIACSFLCLGAPDATAQSFQSSAAFAYLMDYESGAALYEKNADALMAPASMSKLMTAEIVFHELQEARLHLDDQFEVSEHAWRTGGAPAHGSAMFLEVHSHVRVEDLIRGLVVQSGNDAAITLAEGVGGTEENFTAMMNKRAAELGLTRSTFANPWGKDDPHERVTPRELALLAAHIIRDYPNNYHYFGETEFTWNKVRQLNRNPLLTMDLGADGLKTGETADGGFGLVGSAVENGQRLIVVINGLKNAADRAEEARKLLVWGFRSFDARTLFQPGEEVGSASVFGGAQGEVPLASDKPVKVFLAHGADDRLIAKIVYRGPLVAPVEKGVEVARLKVWRDQQLVLDTPLRTSEAVGLGSLRQRAFDAGVELALDLLRKPFAKN
ncbi:MAG TPA: D-alanyl-D-alanine carboxypeptidase family protein [Roseiarcus sp.]|nr:D-alanyl-D-alanine carboxypeptidase family protein [Roseiarcus sp.]